MPHLLSRACGAFLFLECASALAASLQISPVSIQLTGSETGKVINLRNDGDQPIHAQVRVFAWDQANEEDTLAPTRELIASPPIAEVPAGEQQVIRVIRADAAPAPKERAYRLLVDELPPNSSATGTNIQFRFRYSVPLFVSPGGETLAPKLKWSVVEKNGKPYLRVTNSGTMHAHLSAVRLKSGATDIPVSSGLLGYVLPGRVRAWILPDAARAMRSAATEITANVNGNSIRETLTNGAP